MYVAETPLDNLVQYLYMGTFGESSKATRPIVILYDIPELEFHIVDTIPEFYSAGNLIWRHDNSGIIGTVWWNHPFPLGCPSCTNRKSQVCFLSKSIS